MIKIMDKAEWRIRAVEHGAELAKVKKQLAIAVEALELYKNLRGDGTLTNYESIAEKALQQIEELEK